MKKFLQINKKIIIRDSDKIIFSARDMKIFKFNDKGFEIVKTIIQYKDGIEKKELFALLKKNYSLEELEHIIQKMIDNKIIIIK